MTASRAPAEPTVREFEATVESVDGREVVLDETYFYPESGGQPADRGTLDGHLVDDVVERDGEVVHALDAEPEALSLAAGDAVTGLIDDAFRTYCARAHTASHVLYGAARRIADDLGYAGFDISETKVRVDLTTAEPLDDDDLIELERLANRAVWDSLPVTWETHSAEDAREIDGIAFNTKTEEGAMSDGAVRVVTVGGASAAGDGAAPDAEPWDVAACGGTHVSNTAEIGPIAVLERSNPGEGVTRVEFAVGPTAIDEIGAVHAAALDAATTLDARVGDLPDAVSRLRDETDRLEADLRDAREELLATRLRDLPTAEVDGARWAIGTVDDADPNELREPASEALGAGEGDAGDGPDALAAVGTGAAPFLVVAAAENAAVDAGEVVGAVTEEFGGGGGGGPTFAQGGGLDADPAAVAAWLRER